MSSIEEVRQILDMSHDNVNRALAGIMVAKDSMNEYTAAVTNAMSTSNKPEASEAIAKFNRAINDLDEVIRLILSGNADVSTVIASL